MSDYIEKIKKYLNRVDELERKLEGEDKDTFQLLIYSYNECAKLLNKKEEAIKEAIDYIKNNTYKCQWGDLEQDNEDITISDDLTETEFIEDLLQILERADK